MDLPKLQLNRGIGGRRSARRELSCDISLGSESNFYVGVTENISEGGVFVATESPLPIGTRITLHFSLPSGEVEAMGEVRWHRPATPNQKGGVGVHFTSLTDEDRERVMAFLEERQPLFHTE